MYRHDQMTGRKPLPQDYELAAFILQLLTARGVTEVSRTQISHFLWRNFTSRRIACGLDILDRRNQARCSKVPGAYAKPREMWHALESAREVASPAVLPPRWNRVYPRSKPPGGPVWH